MTSGRLGVVIRKLRAVQERASDGQLLEQFLAGRDEAAFEALVRRHGPMVLGVCRRVLGNVHDAEDAFQATFLVLASRGASVRRRGMVGNWLYGVARRTALQAKRSSLRRRAKEAGVMPREASAADPWEGLREVLDAELERLPEKYRAPLVLCDLEGRTRREAAGQLNWPEGTVATRLAQARRLMAQRLQRYGFLPAGGALAAVLSQSAAPAVMPGALVSSTVKAAVLLAAGQAVTVTTPATLLMREVVRTMLISKLKLVMAAGMVAMAFGASGLVYRTAGHATAADASQAGKPPSELEALRRKVELLQINLDLVLEKVRAQEAELRTFRANAAAAKGPKEAASVSVGDVLLNTVTDSVPIHRVMQDARLEGFLIQQDVTLTPDQQVEAAMKAFREASDNAAKQRAVDQLESALKRLRQRIQETGKGQPQMK
jgi:RNA polymerase sigma factor (sigma-70 family)